VNKNVGLGKDSMKEYVLEGYKVHKVSSEGECELKVQGGDWVCSSPERIIVILPIEEGIKLLGRHIQLILRVSGEG
jgi:hypothetical protein